MTPDSALKQSRYKDSNEMDVRLFDELQTANHCIGNAPTPVDNRPVARMNQDFEVLALSHIHGREPDILAAFDPVRVGHRIAARRSLFTTVIAAGNGHFIIAGLRWLNAPKWLDIRNGSPRRLWGTTARRCIEPMRNGR